MLISVKGTGKNQLQPGEESVGDDPVLSHCSLLWNIKKRKKLPVSWSIVKTGKKLLILHLEEGEKFPSANIPKTTMNINVNFFIHINTSGKFTSEFL